MEGSCEQQALKYYFIIVTWKDTLVGAEADLAREQGMKCAHGFNETGTDFMNEVLDTDRT